jgi:hypothetical protein
MNILKSTFGLIETARNFRAIEPSILIDRIPDSCNSNGRKDAYCVDLG